MSGLGYVWDTACISEVDIRYSRCVASKTPDAKKGQPGTYRATKQACRYSAYILMQPPALVLPRHPRQRLAISNLVLVFTGLYEQATKASCIRTRPITAREMEGGVHVNMESGAKHIDLRLRQYFDLRRDHVSQPLRAHRCDLSSRLMMLFGWIPGSPVVRFMLTFPLPWLFFFVFLFWANMVDCGHVSFQIVVLGSCVRVYGVCVRVYSVCVYAGPAWCRGCLVKPTSLGAGKEVSSKY